MPGYWNAHSDRDWEEECHMHDQRRPDWDNQFAETESERNERLRLKRLKRKTTPEETGHIPDPSDGGR